MLETRLAARAEIFVDAEKISDVRRGLLLGESE
jgi:hypothetical protein